MSTICLVSCTSRKADFPTSAENLYRSALFDSASSYAKTRSDAWFILSAKFGLLAPEEHISPYDESLHSMDREARYSWAQSVFQSLSKILKAGDRVIFLAGKLYREHLESMIASLGLVTAAPLSELGIGSQVGWLQRLGKEKNRIEDLDRLYSLLNRLAEGVGGRRFLGVSSAKSNWPDKGLYFFFEPTQFRMLCPFDLRVVRVGTHGVSAGSKSSLWNRLRTHRGGENGSGNHRGSIFRLHVGEALARSSGLDAVFPNWGVGQTASKEIREAEEELELHVSEILGKMSLLWISIGDASGPSSDRAYLEKNIIGLLSGAGTGPVDLATGGTGWATGARGHRFASLVFGTSIMLACGMTDSRWMSWNDTSK